MNVGDSMDDKFITIPERIYRDTRLSPRAVLLYGLVLSLTQNGFCWANYRFLAERLGVSKDRISRLVSELTDFNLIRLEKDLQSGKRCIYPIGENNVGIGENTNTPCQKHQYPIGENTNHRIINREDNRESVRTPVKSKSFKPPTVGEVQTYCTERGNGIDAQHFVDYYEARGWKLGKDTMKNWKAAVRTWERRGQADGQAPARPTTPKLRMIIKPDGTKEAVYLDD